MFPLISIIVPVYNGECYLYETLKSVSSQTYQNYELILVNDGSRDSSADIIENFILQDSRCRIIHQANSGVAEARNSGIRASKGDYIALLDQDDTWEPHKLAAQVDYLREHPHASLVHTQIGFVDENSTLLPTPSWAWVDDLPGDSLLALYERNRIATFTVLFRRRVIESVGLFREAFAPSDDWDYWLRLALSFNLGFIPDTLGHYRVHSTNASRDQQRMQLAEVRVVENFPKEFPEVKSRISILLLRNRRCRIYTETALFFERTRQIEKAREYWMKAATQQILPFQPLAGVLWTSLPDDWRKIIKWNARRLSNYARNRLF